MTVDFKISIWERVKIPEGMEIEVLEKIKNGDIRTANDIFTLSSEYEDVEGRLDYNQLLDTEQTLSVSENDGYATLEVRDDEGEIIYKNGKTIY